MQKLNVEFVRTDSRGSLIQINTGEWKQSNYLIIDKGNEFGGHYHKHKRELFYVTKGKINIQVIDKQGGKNIVLERTDGCVVIEPYDLHSLYAIEDSEIVELLDEPYDLKDIWIE